MTELRTATAARGQHTSWPDHALGSTVITLELASRPA
jgi:hypothetical protein